MRRWIYSYELRTSLFAIVGMWHRFCGVGTFAPLAGEVLHGCGRFGAAFYSLAANGYNDLFYLSITDDAASQKAVSLLRKSHRQWRGNTGSSNVSVGTVRSSCISDEQLAPWRDDLSPDRVEEAEAITISMKQSIQHGDLHGLNVLVDSEGGPLIIDYGNLARHPVALDPVTLEMSFVFHAEHPELHGWPSIEQASRWFDLAESRSRFASQGGSRCLPPVGRIRYLPTGVGGNRIRSCSTAAEI